MFVLICHSIDEEASPRSDEHNKHRNDLLKLNGSLLNGHTNGHVNGIHSTDESENDK